MSELHLNKAVTKKKRKKEKGKEYWGFSEGNLFSEHGAVYNYFISLFALTTGKLKAKYESGSVQGPTEHLVYSLHPQFILFFILPLLPLCPSFLTSVCRMWL